MCQPPQVGGQFGESLARVEGEKRKREKYKKKERLYLPDDETAPNGQKASEPVGNGVRGNCDVSVHEHVHCPPITEVAHRI